MEQAFITIGAFALVIGIAYALRRKRKGTGGSFPREGGTKRER